MDTKLPLVCSRCGQDLDPEKAVWLELNVDTLRISKPGEPALPESESQGAFPFGSDCARRVAGKCWGDGPGWVE